MIQSDKGEIEIGLLNNVTSALSDTIKDLFSTCSPEEITTGFLVHGKFLRTRLAARLIGPDVSLERLHRITCCCVAIELAHAASLYHDDVIDKAMVRRGSPVFWRRYGVSASVLTGDLLLCGALSVVLRGGDMWAARFFSEKVTEMCKAEVEQELLLRGKRLTAEKCLAIARNKTGSLFAFAAGVCAADSEQLRAFEEAGYAIGTAYQLADDLVDETGDEVKAGKTLGTDRLRNKFTLAHDNQQRPGELILHHVNELRNRAINILTPWPRAVEGLKNFLAEEMNKAPGNTVQLFHKHTAKQA